MKNLISLVFAMVIALPASATIVLEGSDATTFHGHSAGGHEYTEQLWAFLRQGSSLPVVVLNAGGSIPHADPGTVRTGDLSGLSVAAYSALYIESPTGCCGQNLAGASAWSAEISAFVAAGGSVAIQNYTGGDWSFVAPFLSTPPPGTVMGYDTGFGGPGCTDNEVFNNEALIRGFTQPPALGCWEHQAYSVEYFVDDLGFLSLVDADPAYFGTATENGTSRALGSALLAYGGALGTPGCTDPRGCGPTTSVPAPGNLALFGLGLIGLAATRRRFNRR